MADERFDDVEPDWDAGDYDLPEEVPVEEGEASRFHAAEKAKMDEFEKEVLLPNLIEEVVTAPVDAWLGLLMLHRDDELREKNTKVNYTEEFVTEALKGLYPESIFYEKFVGYEVRLLGKACATAISNLVYSNEGGKAHMAMQAKAVLKDGLWVVDHEPKNKQVIAITSQHAIDLQLFCCSVALATVTKTMMIDKRPKPVQTPKLVEKNVNQKETLPLSVKKLFRGLLQFKKDEVVNSVTMETAPFIWKAIYHAVKGFEIPLSSLPLPLVYFKWINLNFGYTPKVCKLEDVYYSAYPPVLKELSHTVANHSVMVGGVFLNARHFENEAIKHSKCRHIGGEFSKDLCFYNTNNCVTWEMAGATIEHPRSGLETEVASIRPARDFDGLWWNPVNDADVYAKAKGLIVPYDKNGVGLRKVKAWVNLPKNKKSYFRIWCHYGAMPALWVEKVEKEDPYAALFNPYACDILWKCMGVMGIYNMMASLNSNHCLSLAKGNKAVARKGREKLFGKGIPTVPLFCTIVNGSKSIKYSYTKIVDKRSVPAEDLVPSFVNDFMPEGYLPGRWTINAAESSETDTLREGFGHYAAYADHLRGEHGGFTRAADRKAEDPIPEPEAQNANFSRDAYGPARKRKKAEKDEAHGDDDDDEDFEDDADEDDDSAMDGF